MGKKRKSGCPLFTQNKRCNNILKLVGVDEVHSIDDAQEDGNGVAEIVENHTVFENGVVEIRGDSEIDVVGTQENDDVDIPNLSGVEHTDGDTISWNEGRRIVELKVLAEGLKECGEDDCNERLDLRNIVGETISGFGSWLDIECSKCGFETKVPTGKTKQSTGRGGRPSFHINTKIAGAMIHSGIGASTVQKFMSAIEV